MSTRLIWSLASAGVFLVVWVIFLIIGMADRPKARERAAQQLAKQLDLFLPPEFADELGRRIWRSAVVAGLIAGPFFVAWAAWYVYYQLLLPFSLVDKREVPPMVPVIPIFILGGLAAAAGHLYDTVHESRTAGPQVARIGQPCLADAIPPILTWAVRCTAALPLLAAATWLFAPVSVQYGAYAARPQPLLYAAAAILAPLTVVATEALQKRILRGRQHAASAMELAFDDALRVRTMLSLLIVPCAACVTAEILIAAPLGYHASWAGSLPVGLVTTLISVPACFLVPVAVNRVRVRRYFIGRFDRFSIQAQPAAPDLVAGC